MNHTGIPRPEFPRPDFERDEWLNLNGQWDFEFDDEEVGLKESWYTQHVFSKQITVPFVFQCEASGINNQELHRGLWYQKSFTVPNHFYNKRMLLTFSAVDFEAFVWVNGVFQGTHRGGYTPFSFDITNALHAADSENNITVFVRDDVDCSQPRGKQFWKEKNDRCWYTPSSGIWQTVYITALPDVHIEHIKHTPDIDKSLVYGMVTLNKTPSHPYQCAVRVSYKGEFQTELLVCVSSRITAFTIHIKEADYIDEIHYWTPDTPNLYDVCYTLSDSQTAGATGNTLCNTDCVRSYIGMRKISIREGIVLLNNKPFFQKLILNQGYWDETLLTAPSDEALQYDIMLMKQFGFNGVRMHQKIEDPRFYYWADKMGLVVWGEMPSGYQFCDDECTSLSKELTDFIVRDYNHPSLILWVPLNESWGVRNIVSDSAQQNLAQWLMYQIKTLDQTRLVSANDGWEQVSCDICGIHDYAKNGEALLAKWQDKDALLSAAAQTRLVYADTHFYTGEPILLTEFGGIAFERQMGGDNWGYAGAVKDEREFFERFESLVDAIQSLGYIQGYCYTQFADVMQETNGLCDSAREPKVPPESIAKILK